SAEMLRVLGPHAAATLAPGSGRVGALVRVPVGTTPASIGLDEVAPGIGRLRASPDSLLAFADAHPDLHLEIAPPLKLLLDKAGSAVKLPYVKFVYNLRGENVVVGIADTGLDVGHPDFLDEQAHTRVAWMLDLSLAPVGKHPELE